MADMNKTKVRKSARGGARPGAGRKKKYGSRLIQKTVRVAPVYLATVATIHPSFDTGIKIILDDPGVQAAILNLSVRK